MNENRCFEISPFFTTNGHPDGMMDIISELLLATPEREQTFDSVLYNRLFQDFARVIANNNMDEVTQVPSIILAGYLCECLKDFIEVMPFKKIT